MGINLENKKPNSVKLSIFGLEQHANPKLTFENCFQKFEGIRTARLDIKKNIGFVKWSSNARITKEDVISVLFSCGFAAEEWN